MDGPRGAQGENFAVLRLGCVVAATGLGYARCREKPTETTLFLELVQELDRTTAAYYNHLDRKQLWDKTIAQSMAELFCFFDNDA
jgi:hypothetical protein